MTAGSRTIRSTVPPLVRFDRWLTLAVAAFSALALLYLMPVFPAHTMSAVDNYISEFLLLSLTVVLFATAALRGPDRGNRQFWWLMTAAFAAWLCSQVTGIFIRDDAPWLHNFLKDVLLLAMSCLAVVAVDLQPGAIKSSMQSLRARLAALSSVLLIVGIFGYTALVPALSGIQGYTSPFEVYSILDAYIALRFLLRGIASGNREWRATLLLIAIGFALITVADLLVVAFRNGWLTYVPGQPLNLVWFLFYVPLFMASRVGAGRPEVVPRADRGDWSDSQQLAPILAYSVAIPVVHLSGYGFGVLDPDSRVVRDLFVLGWLLAATAGLTWQYLLLRERVRRAEAEKVDAEKESADLQAQVRQAQRIELVGQLTGGLAHEFGNSLFGAESFAQTLLRDARDHGDENQEKHALGLIGALSGSRDLVRKFNYLGRGEDIRPEIVDVVAEVRTTLDLLRPGVGAGIKLSFHHDADEIGAIARKQDLQQMVLNLVLNARDAIGDSGFIDVHVGQGEPGPAACTSCGALITGEQVFLRVSDSGPGIPAGIRHRIFEPLVSSKPAGKGSGLGLSIVHTLVHQLHGHVVLGDARRAHCSFTILLPTVQLDVSDGMNSGNGPARYMLVVESDQQLADSIRSNPALHALHINHVSSVDAAEVVLQQQERTPEKVFIGRMQNPLDVVAIVNAAALAEPPAEVILCAPRQQRAILASLGGIDRFLDRPVDVEELAAVMLHHPVR